MVAVQLGSGSGSGGGSEGERQGGELGLGRPGTSFFYFKHCLLYIKIARNSKY